MLNKAQMEQIEYTVGQIIWAKAIREFLFNDLSECSFFDGSRTRRIEHEGILRAIREASIEYAESLEMELQADLKELVNEQNTTR